MPQTRLNRAREKRITDEIVVDAYTPEERARIVENADGVIEFLGRHDGERVGPGRGIAGFFEESHSISLAKENGRCAFSYRDECGQLRPELPLHVLGHGGHGGGSPKHYGGRGQDYR